VLLPVFNGERYVAEAIASVLEQSLRALELVVVDDGSTDGTPRLLAEDAARAARVVVVRQDNAGLPPTLNRGLALARAELVARLDADDQCLPGRLERQREHLRAHPRVLAVGGAAQMMDEDGRVFEQSRYPLSPEEVRRAFAYTTPIVHPGVMFRRSAVMAAGGYRACSDAEDLDLWLRLAERGDLANLADALVRYRVHPGQLSARKIELQGLGVVAAHLAARARAAHEPDPLDGAPETIDEDWLLARGASRAQIAATVVKVAVAMAKLAGRAGEPERAELLLDAAARRARAEPRPGALLATIHEARARRRALEGRPLAARVQRGRAWLAARRG
jgi:glycosyltransferase involved in cell wall biosynthesis